MKMLLNPPEKMQIWMHHILRGSTINHWGVGVVLILPAIIWGYSLIAIFWTHSVILLLLYFI